MQTFTQQLMIAAPALQDPFFKHAVIYVCEHDQQGAMGIMINRPLSLTLDELCQQSDVADPTPAYQQTHIFQGGPIAQERGFVLHSDDVAFESTLNLQPGLCVTTSKDVLSSFGQDNMPNDFLVALGYAGWEEGQLEQEIQDNAWLVVPADVHLIFNTPIHERWEKSISVFGINSWQISSDIGHA